MPSKCQFEGDAIFLLNMPAFSHPFLYPPPTPALHCQVVPPGGVCAERAVPLVRERAGVRRAGARRAGRARRPRPRRPGRQLGLQGHAAREGSQKRERENEGSLFDEAISREPQLREREKERAWAANLMRPFSKETVIVRS